MADVSTPLVDTSIPRRRTLRRLSRLSLGARHGTSEDPGQANPSKVLTGKLKTVECPDCGASVWSAAQFCCCGASIRNEQHSTVERIITRQRTMTRDMHSFARISAAYEEDAEDQNSDICCFCSTRIRETEDFCPLDDEREFDGPKLHPACWEHVSPFCRASKFIFERPHGAVLLYFVYTGYSQILTQMRLCGGSFLQTLRLCGANGALSIVCSMPTQFRY